MAAVSNSTPLIYLGKVKRLALLREVYQKVYVCSDVWQDTIFPVTHARSVPEDVPVIIAAREEGWLKIRDIRTEEAREIRDELIAQGLGVGESHSIALAKELNAIFLANDKAAIEAARAYNVETRWFTEILYDALRIRSLSSVQEFLELLDACRARGLYVSRKNREEAIRTARQIG